MNRDKRTLLKAALAGLAGLGAGASTAGSAATASGRTSADSPPSSEPASPSRRPRADVPYKRIATEEAWVTSAVLKQYRVLLRDPEAEPGFLAMWRQIDSYKELVPRLLDVGSGRLHDMDLAGTSKQVLSLTSPGVQVFDADTGTALAADSNDELAQAIAANPDRFAGLLAIAPQDPRRAAREIERGMTKLKLNGIIINSHTQGEYLDDAKFWEIFEAAEACHAPIYLHPNTPSKQMLQPYLERHFHADLGFFAEVALHTMAIIEAGVFDRFPRLELVIGHGGEGLPYLMYRLDYLHHKLRTPQWGRGKSRENPSYYMKTNIYTTTSGVAWAPAIQFAQATLGVDRVLYAMDYPYQFDVAEVAMDDDLPISAADKKKFYQTNAEKVFSL